MTALIPDWSHYQVPNGIQPDWGQIESEVASGMLAGLIFKATENMGKDSAFDTFRQNAEDRKIRWMAYPFLRPGDTDSTIKHFVKVVGKGAIACLDWEAPGVGAVVVEEWMKVCEDELGRPGMVYYGYWPPETATARIGQWLRWYPQYPSNPNGPSKLPAWDGTSIPTDWRKQYFLWQYTGNGSLAGLGAQTDLSRLSCPTEVFNKWYDTGVLETWAIPVVKTAPQYTITRTLTLHSSGQDVVTLQLRLGLAGFPVASDGQFGPATKAAVISFQNSKGLVADGIAGPKTLSALPMIV